ncbi:OmpA family protein [Methylococcus sp. EFPC2]|uniref:OmpA family protein n=1 Tax=Methylococcus sp. EFPC2 TaxID=2812648 RepID=UPI0019673E5D|nr:OmpA family protein [Methylococcus sp. EFPC2]QSA97785.1 OmpA family protein [Methylococcus sp. EFPC2]
MNDPRKRTPLKLCGILLPAILAMLSGCASQPLASFQAFTPEDLNPKVKSGEYKQKVDNFLVILDASGSMDDIYFGAGFPETSSADKFNIEKELLSRVNKTIPALKLNSGLRTFGFGPCLGWSFTRLNAPLAAYSPTSFQSALDSQECSSGGSPMADALNAAAGDLQTAQGKTAIILVSDGKQTTGDPHKAVEQLKQQYGDRLCLHTVWVGNPGEPGQTLMGSLPSIAGCGTSSSAGEVASRAGAADFVTKVFLKPGVVDDCSIRDSDGDGVNDCNDQCPDSPRGAKVNRKGCWVLNNVLFDTDKATIKPVSYPELDDAARVFEVNPGLRVEVDGHTDSRASEAHNLDLSQRRAEAVRDYFIRHGVAPNRLTAQGFGESRPVADNDTDEGRALNRRVELKVIK